MFGRIQQAQCHLWRQVFLKRDVRLVRGLANAAKDDNSTTGRRVKPIAAVDVPSSSATIYPKPFQVSVQGRMKRKLGNMFDLTKFGVNLTILKPESSSALQHYHSKQDEFIYILRGTATLRLGQDEIEMCAGDCVGFKAGEGTGHCITNRHATEHVEYLEIGDRTAGDEVKYPEVDLQAKDENDQWVFSRKTGELYDDSS